MSVDPIMQEALAAGFKAMHAETLRMANDAACEIIAKLERQIRDAREAFLNLIADASVFQEDWDGDCDDYGRSRVSVTYRLETDERQLRELVEALGLKVAYDETAGAAALRTIERGDEANLPAAISKATTGEAP